MELIDGSPAGANAVTPATTMALDLPEVVAEVAAAFAAYERALVERDLDAMGALFAPGDAVVRYGIGDRQRGAAALAAWRATQRPLPPGRSLFETAVSTFGTSFAVVATCFSYPGRTTIGRQSQTWVRTDDGWKIVHAHVSEVPGP